MILYKYYGYCSGLKAIESQNLGFRKPKNFNDPFEFSFLSNSEGSISEQKELKKKVDALRDTVVVLSLTRTPYNPLMWAHYGQEHTGFVIGYEVDDAFLSSSEYNLIPVTSGDVVYTNTKSSHILSPEIMGCIHDVYLSGFGDDGLNKPPETISFARKIFLTKHASWVYEEEVRAVKILDSLFEESHIFQGDERRSFYSISKEIEPGKCVDVIPGLSLFNYKVPIKEIYLGLRNNIDKIPIINGAKVYRLEMNERSWNLISKEVGV